MHTYIHTNIYTDQLQGTQQDFRFPTTVAFDTESIDREGEGKARKVKRTEPRRKEEKNNICETARKVMQ